MMQQCLTCSRRNIPPEQTSCPACGSVDLRGYDPAAPTYKIPDMWLAGRAGHYEREGVEPAEAVRRAVADWMEQERREQEYEEGL